jgi:hypothetical protein
MQHYTGRNYRYLRVMIRFSPFRAFFLFCALILPDPRLCPEPYSSPRWGFYLDLPPDYRLARDQESGLSFRNPQGSVFEISPAAGEDPEAFLAQVLRRLGNGSGTGGTAPEPFDYHGRRAALARLEFSLDSRGNPRPSPGQGRAYLGWGLCVDRGEDLLLALAYGPAETPQEVLHLSCLDSLAPGAAERLYWGPVTAFTWPRGELVETPLYNSGVTALIGAADAEAAQDLVDREFQVLRRFERSPQWREAWSRFYRMIRRDSWERLRDALFRLERNWSAEALLGSGGTQPGRPSQPGNAGDAGDHSRGPGGLSDRELASRALSYVQDFRYERDLMGSDFVNLVSAVTEGRGDCDSRALLWALFLAQANIDAGIMVSQEYGHAMGIADIEGAGARFPFENRRYLVAETTARVDLGLIGQNVSEIAKWLGIVFDSPAW